ncbi:MAG: single-stranded DNA-binding protein [Acidobacteria bacterium]|nr:single-stranded DNA-binding protein [Acidobacteriota bacterium]
MSGSINKVILIGRLGRDPEVKYTPSGQAVAKFSIATDETYKDRNGEQQRRTEWHNIVAWRRLAEICGEYLVKGKLVYIEGRLRTRKWEDREGNKRSTTEIEAREMQMLSPKGEGDRSESSSQQSESTPAPAPAPSPEITDDDIPF